MEDLYNAILKFQEKPPVIHQDAVNPFHNNKYATLSNIMGVVLPKLNSLGLVLIQHTANEEENPGHVAVETHIVHVKTGQELCSMLTAKTDGDPQRIGSAITYLRRYGLCSVLGLVTEADDDGNSATEKQKGSEVHEGPEPKTDEVIQFRDEKEAGMRSKILDICMTIAGGDTDQAGGVLKELTEWTDKQGKLHPGITKGKQLNKVKGRALGAIYGNAKKALEDWETTHGTEAAERELEFANEDIEF